MGVRVLLRFDLANWGLFRLDFDTPRLLIEFFD